MWIDNLLSYLAYWKISVKAIFDQNENLPDKTIYGSVSINRMKDISRIENPSKAFFLIYTYGFKDIDQMEITNMLNKAGVDKYYLVSKEERKEI